MHARTSSAPSRWVAAAVAMVVATLMAAPLPASAAPTIGGTSRATYTEGADPTPVAQGVTIANGASYGGQYLHFSIDGASADESLGLVRAASPVKDAGAVSVVGTSVYLGNGTSADVIGSINATHDGANGSDLRVDFVSDFQNAGFESGDFTDWTTLDQRVDLGTSEIAGCDTVDTSTYPAPVPNEDDNAPAGPGTIATQVIEDGFVIFDPFMGPTPIETSEGEYAARLYSEGVSTQLGYDVVHGPAVYSSEFEAAAGDSIYFDWRAAGGGDAYHVFGYIIDESCEQTELLDAVGDSSFASTDWATVETEIPTSGTYRFVFVSGTFDYSGGFAAGASLFIDNVQVYGNQVNDAVAQAVARTLTYENASDNPPRRRTVTVTAQSVSEGSGSAEIVVDIVPVDVPVAVGAISAARGDGSVTLSWDAPADNGSPITDYVIQWSSDGGSTWHTFDDGTSSKTTATVTGLVNGTGYVFRVAAVNGVGSGSFSDRTKTIVPSVPPFEDTSTSEFQEDITWMKNHGITKGCNPPANDRYCPESYITRAEVATYLDRLLGLGAATTDWFSDDETSIHEGALNRTAEAHVFRGCNPPANHLVCPDETITRGELAAVLVRALDLDPGSPASYVDADGHLFESEIAALGGVGITKGCNPPANDRFCPDRPITRGEVAAFLHRAATFVG